jgi:pimeloyl-ACP methyl ester carboxylesterase
MSSSAERATVEVDGQPASFLTAGTGTPILLLHGTYWSRVWQPVVGLLADRGLRPVAVDLPGCGRSAGELDAESATVPALAGWVERFLDALGVDGRLGVAGHDIGGAIAQRLAMRGARAVERLALVNSVTYDSWPVPGVARFRDPRVVEGTSTGELVAMREQALTTAIARPMSRDELAEYLEPWRERRVARSWMALAGAADSRYTTELVAELRGSRVPKLLVWGEDDTFQPVGYAERFAAEMRATELRRIPRAGHIPMENAPGHVGAALARFFGA